MSTEEEGGPPPPNLFLNEFPDVSTYKDVRNKFRLKSN